MNNVLKKIALYLPQYHEIKENNEWWGEGFTEWTNVKKAKSLFKGHYQPHKPMNENYYDLSSNDILVQQASIAKNYGIDAFCFYHYWFNGKLLLETPLHNLLNSKEPDINFCLSWANENWTRAWDGQEKQVLMQQDYSLADDLKHIQYLIPFFKDPRYLKINGKPVFLMYRSELHPEILAATNLWREEAKKEGFPDLYLIRMENFTKDLNPSKHGFDAGMEFAPDVKLRGDKITKRKKSVYLFNKFLNYTGLRKSHIYANGIFSYRKMVSNMINKPKPDYKYFRCISPSWDNSARRKKNAAILFGSTPQLFGYWAKKMKDYSDKNLPADEKLLFINAWNEWGEGCHLEPDEKWGFAYLQALKDNTA